MYSASSDKVLKWKGVKFKMDLLLAQMNIKSF